MCPPLSSDLALLLLPGAARRPRATSSDADRAALEPNVQQGGSVAGKRPGGGQGAQGAACMEGSSGRPPRPGLPAERLRYQLRPVLFDISNKSDGCLWRTRQAVWHGRGV